MAARKYTCTTNLHFALWDAGAEHELEAVFTYRVVPGCGASLEGPAEPASVEIDRLVLRDVQGRTERPCPIWLHEALCEDEGTLRHLLDDANETDEAARDDAADARRSEALEARV